MSYSHNFLSEYSANFADFRKVFKAKLESAFIVPAKTFDNVTGSFPIGFFVWLLNNDKFDASAKIDVFDTKGEFLQTKEIIDYNQVILLSTFGKIKLNEGEKQIGHFAARGNDFQNQNKVFIDNKTKENIKGGGVHIYISARNLIEASTSFAVRQCIPATWLNDRDQFLYPNDGWRLDRNFQSDCLAFTLFHGQNRISSEQGENHWIPFTEQQVNAPDNFKSHFMSDFIAGKCAPANAATLFGEEESLIPSEPIVFTPAAQAVMEAGRKIWEYYMTHKKNVYGAAPVNVNASFYDIRAYFQGRDEKGKMNSESSDQTYTSLIKDLRAAQKVLARQIEKKVYLYGFLKGEVEVNKDELLAEYQERVKKLEHQLHAQQSGSLVNYGTVNIYEK